MRIAALYSHNWDDRFGVAFSVVYALTLWVGAAYHRFEQDGIDMFYDGDVNGTRPKTRGTAVGEISRVFRNNFGSWLVGDYTKAFAKYDEYHRFEPNADGSGGVMYDIENVYSTMEKTFSEYVQMAWDSHIFGKRVRGNIDVRGYRTKTQSTGWIQGSNYSHLGTANVKGSYSDVLPTLNAVLEVTPEMLLRFGAGQNLNRPGQGSMAARGSAFYNEDSDEITASRGNPDLRLYKDTTLDFSAEYYFGDVGVISASLFQKWIKNFIGSQTLENIPFSETGVPSSTIPGATDNSIVREFSMPMNVPGTKSITGLELAAQG